MGSRSPDGQQQTPGGSNSPFFKPTNNGAKIGPSGSSSADLDRGIVSDDDDDDANSAFVPGMSASVPNASIRKKNTRKRTKKKKTKSAVLPAAELKQTSPPGVLVSALFPANDYPTGELVQYENTNRVTDEESRYCSRLWDADFLVDYRKAAEIHRQVRRYAQKELIKPGVTLSSVADGIEDGIRALSGHQGMETGDFLQAGMGFPTGLCLNNIAAHWTPNPGGKEVVLDKSDVLKVDFGVHVNGRIVDSAFTVSFDHKYDNLLAAVQEATNTGIKNAGIDARMKSIGAAIQEVMESYEVEIGGRSFPVKAVRNITGHDILRYQIHGGKQIPFITNNNKDKMEEGEVFAIETFGSTGRGVLRDDVGIYGYGRNADVSGANLQLWSAKSLLKTIDTNFKTIVFCRRYLERLGIKHYHLGLRALIDNGVIDTYAPLADEKGSYTAQFEHTVLLHSGGKEVISRGEDY